MAYGIVYLLIDGTNDKEYVGQTKRTFKERFGEHKRGDQYVDRAIQEHGEENFATAILKECDSKEELDFFEQHFIRSRNTMEPNGYNRTGGGEFMQGFQALPEVVAKAVATRKKTFASKSPEELRQMTANARAVAMARTPEERGVASKKAWKNRTPEERSAVLKKSWDTRRANEAAKTPEEREAYHKKLSESVKRGNQKRTPEERSASARKGRAGMSAEARFVMVQRIFVARRAETPFKNLLAEIDKRQFNYSSLAKLMGMSRKSISLKMCGKVKFSAKDIAKLVEIFDKPAEYLMQRDD